MYYYSKESLGFIKGMTSWIEAHDNRNIRIYLFNFPWERSYSLRFKENEKFGTIMHIIIHSSNF